MAVFFSSGWLSSFNIAKFHGVNELVILDIHSFLLSCEWANIKLAIDNAIGFFSLL
jgi:hypothetical protein